MGVRLGSRALPGDLGSECTRRTLDERGRFSRLVRGGILGALFVGLALTGAAPAPAATVRLGVGVGQWHLDDHRVVVPGLIASERYSDNETAGCIVGTRSASRVDYYPGLRLGWVGSYLFDVATTRVGDRSTDGFVIGGSRFRQVRTRHPGAYVAGPGDDPFALGDVQLQVYRRTGYESHFLLTYWFARGGRLVALETEYGGC
jgi:hypothetical protein